MQKRSSGGCSSLPLLLFFIFLVLKLAGAIDWSWWWVTSPLWLPAVLALGGLLVAAVMGVSIYKIVDVVLKKQRAGRSQMGRSQTERPQAGRQSTLQEEVIDVEGSEVPASPPAEGEGPPSTAGRTSA